MQIRANCSFVTLIYVFKWINGYNSQTSTGIHQFSNTQVVPEARDWPFRVQHLNTFKQLVSTFIYKMCFMHHQYSEYIYFM